MKTLVPAMLYISLITLITLAGLIVSEWRPITQRLGVLFLLFMLALAWGLVLGIVLAIIHHRRPKAAKITLLIYALTMSLALSVLYVIDSYTKVGKNLDVRLYTKWCMSDSDRLSFLSIVENHHDQLMLEIFMAKGAKHPSPYCAQLNMAIYHVDVVLDK